MKIRSLCLCVVLCAGAAFAQPAIAEKGVRGAAPASPGKLAQGSAFFVIGSGLGPEEAVMGEVPYGTELAGTRVRFQPEEGEAAEAFVVSAASSRVEGIVPSNLPEGKYKVIVVAGEDSSEPVEVEVVSRNAGLATMGAVAGGLVQGRARHGDEWAPITLLAPARPGGEIELEMAGLGPIDAPDNENPPETALADEAFLLVGGKLEVPASYLGRNPARPGYDLVRASLPADELPLGCGVEVQVKIGDRTTRRALLPLASDDGPCQHPLGWTAERMQEILDGSPVTIATATLASTTTILALPDEEEFPPMEISTEGFTAAFERLKLADFAPNLSQESNEMYLNRNGCILILGEDEDVEAAGVALEMLDAGEELELAGPGGLDEKVRKSAETLIYQAQFASEGSVSIPGLPGGIPIPGLPGGEKKNRIGAGTYRLKGNGGADIGAFEAEIEIRSLMKWEDVEELNGVDRSQPLVFRWTGAAAEDDVWASGMSEGPAPEDPSRKVARGFVCLARGDAGEIRVPAEILSRLPASAAGEDEELPSGVVSLSQSNRQGGDPFLPPLVQGGNVDAGRFGWHRTFSKAGVKFQ